MRVIISIILMVIAALVGFFFGAGMNEAMGGAILLSMITGFACTINAIEKNKKDWQLPVLRIEKIGIARVLWVRYTSWAKGRKKEKYFRGIMEWVINWLSTKNQKKY